MSNTFTQYLTEKFHNLFSAEQKEQYADQVWDILNQSYKPIGGLRGIESKEDMIQSVPMWKVAVIDD